ncbi:hypothetical protein M422DRAFT_32027 [Sphaerobolus stellatus SS14]|uniref:Uncharacterized protein n=1 Tax=Sphaerobolus stellatus (strain SS14) TaxID=990650 RepID=A0A0C9VRK1_SPHS4|nr:hypothetical protein M422DRAFT_32027 [Sphaerobolus stellatus SS14]
MDPPYTVPSSPILRHPYASRHISRHPVTILRGILGSSGIPWPWILVCPQISLSILRATPFLRCTAGSSQTPQDPGISFQLPEAHWDPPETQKELKTVW